MDNTLNRAVELSLAVYRITDKLPKQEVLAQKMRQISIDIIEDLVYNGLSPTNSSGLFNLENWGKKVRVLFIYFSLSEKQEWVNSGNFAALRKEYVRLYRVVENKTDKKDKSVSKKTSAKSEVVPRKIKNVPKEASIAKLTKRQERILQFIKGKANGAAIIELAKFVESSNKTVERELKRLIQSRLVQRTGRTKGARFIIDLPH